MDSCDLKILKNRERRRPDELPIELVQESVLRNHGNLTKVSQDLSVSFARLCNFIDSKPKLVMLCTQSRTQIIDLAEEVLIGHLKGNSLKASMFTLQTLGKNRGYVTRSESHIKQEVKTTNLDVDLSKLTTEQLDELKSIRKTATVIDNDGNPV